MKKHILLILISIMMLMSCNAKEVKTKEAKVNTFKSVSIETFTKQDAEKLLTDKAQTIYVYCRSGRRSKQSSQKLIDFGYTDVIEIGGILSYNGPIEK